MIIFGFNLPFGKRLAGGKKKKTRLPAVIGLGFAWSASDFVAIEDKEKTVAQGEPDHELESPNSMK